MKNKFITLNAKTNDNKYYLNVEHIISVVPYYGEGASVSMVSGQNFHVKEFVEEVMILIAELN